MKFSERLDRVIQEKSMLLHPFYQAWTQGELPLSTLQTYAREYYHHVKAFPTYLSAVHSRTEDMAVRRHLLENLMDEEAGSPNHPDLWRRFALSLGVSEAELDQAPGEAAQELIATFRSLCQSGVITEGLSALYSYESQIPAICTTKIDGLKKHYGLTSPKSWSYFSVHETADIEHAQVERDLLNNLVTKQEEEKALLASQKTVQALWDFLSSFHVECMAA